MLFDICLKQDLPTRHTLRQISTTKDTAKKLSETFGKIMQDRESMSI